MGPPELQLSPSRNRPSPHASLRLPPNCTLSLILKMASSVDQKRLKATKFPPEFDKKVDIEKVNIDLMKKWIANRITTILGDEDDIVVETCYNLIEQNQFVSRPRIGITQRLLTYAAQDQGNPNPTDGLP
ncbi:serine/arginine repetitive matrix 1 [Alternaria alternata]|nr:serine/arginine repetitive matrix 1 [Alternaria alternata]